MKKLLVFIFMVRIVFLYAQTPGPNESQIIVKRSSASSLSTFKVIIDGQVMAELGAGEETRIIVTNGQHKIHIEAFGATKGHDIVFNVFHKEITYITKLSGLSWGLEKTNEISLPESSNNDIELATTGLYGAINRASGYIIKELATGSTIAVISVSSNDRETGEIVVDELEYLLVGARKFKIVDRKTLDTIRAEQNFQMSGDVSDDSAISIGQMSGANIVITGSITGTSTTKRLSLRALDVKTAQIITMAREQF
jgi:hypothetical protein